MADQWKGNKVELSTFLSWGKQSVIGYKTKDENSKTYVVFIWCKCCARNKDAILSNLKGSVRTSALAFIEGTNAVTKYQVSFLFFHSQHSLLFASNLIFFHFVNFRFVSVVNNHLFIHFVGFSSS